MGRQVGRVIEVRGLSVKAKLDELLPPYLVTNGQFEVAPKINSFLKTKVGIEIVICQVIGEYSEEKNGIISGHYLSLQVKGNISNGRFTQGLRMLPIVSAIVQTLDKEDYDQMYKMRAGSINVGVDLFDANRRISIELNQLIPSHIGVFGNTGSGKSNTLTKILKEYSLQLLEFSSSRGKYIVFDLNNEYSGNAIVPENLKTVYYLRTKVESEKRIPFALENLTEDDFVYLLNASEKTQVPVIKNAYRNTFKSIEELRTESFYLEQVRSMITNAKRSLFFSLRHNLSDYFTGIEQFRYHTSSNEFYCFDGNTKHYKDGEYFAAKLNNITVNIPPEPLERFLFEIYFAVAIENENGVLIDFMMPLISRAKKLIHDLQKVFIFSKANELGNLFEGKDICVIQLGNVNNDLKEIVPSLIANHVFSRLSEVKDQRGEVVQIITLVVDEAHTILSNDEERINSNQNVLRIFEKVVKEGRKFGCFLMLASQRPSDISQTIISQLHNYFIHKLVNPSDLARIRKAVAYMDESSLDLITVLAPGECIVSGTAFQMPSFILVDQVDFDNRPNSENVKLTGKDGLLEKKREEKEKTLF